MIQVTYDELMDVLQDAGLDHLEDGIRTDYSGRFMFGERCLGIVGSMSEYTSFVACAAARLDGWDWLQGVQTDSMGLSTIFYWPGVQVTEVPDDA